MIDYHLHPGYSIDAVGNVNEYCIYLNNNGFKEVCFTPHIDLGSHKDSITYTMSDGLIKHYFESIKLARKKFKNMNIMCGFEIDYHQEDEILIRKFIEKHDFDFALGSIHRLSSNIRIADKDEAQTLLKCSSSKNIILDYLEQTIKAINFGVYDSIAHLEIIGKYVKRININEYEDLLIEIVEGLIKSNTALEVNVNGFDFDGSSWPHETILKLFLKYGLENITIGSDVHYPREAGRNIENGLVMLKKIGYENVSTFHNHSINKIRIDKFVNDSK